MAGTYGFGTYGAGDYYGGAGTTHEAAATLSGTGALTACDVVNDTFANGAVLDSFNRANGALGPAWTRKAVYAGVANSTVQISNTRAVPTEKSQQPTRDQIRELEAQLVEGQQIIARNRAAIDVLNGNVAIASGARRRRRASSGGSVNEDRLVDFIAANQPVGATAIGQAVGVTGQNLSRKLSELVEAGKLTKQGEKRGTKYSLRVGLDIPS